MRNSPWFRTAIVCLAFTGVGVAWADSPTGVDSVAPRPSPHADYGSTLRVGTVAGFIYGAPDPVNALGVQVAIGQRLGRLGLEAEGTLMGFQQRGQYMSALGTTEGDVGVGSGERIAALARYDVLRFGPEVDGTRRQLITVYLEGGAGIAWNHWTKPDAGTSRLVPNDTKRTEGQGGFGVMIFPHRVAWLIGWRFAVTPHQPMSGSICRGVSCREVPMADDNQVLDQSMMFQSSLEFTF